MSRVLVVLALVAACHGEHKSKRKDAGLAQGSAFSVSVVPKMPLTDDGHATIVGIDAMLESDKTTLPQRIAVRLAKASLLGHLSDYTNALAESEAFLKTHAADETETALRLRIQALSAVHRFGEARERLSDLAKIIYPAFLPELQVGIDQATGNLDAALATRAQIAKDAPSPQTITLYAMALAEAGRFDEALALMPKATTNVRQNTAVFVNWLLFQWGRIYEQKGDLSIARDFYLEAYKRLPASLETVEHLVLALNQTGDPQKAKQILDAALAENHHPTLMALALKVTGSDAASVIPPEAVAPVAAEWERYVTALPEAFSDHAARFYLDVGGNPKRARELAELNFANRPTFQARALLVEAEIASGDPVAACTAADPLVTAPLRAQQFIAWRALSACGKKEAAQRLGARLGI